MTEENKTTEKQCDIHVVNSCKNYVVITPEGKQITIEEYMETEDYNNKLEQQINDFMTNKKEKELIELFKK